ncbi:MAG: oxidoreductase [Capsulimonas sp.]|uniref:oxidoreductase n=1 Tax=Capsulimonas sp. TaxID=2494211 RepID=UPI003265AA4E
MKAWTAGDIPAQSGKTVIVTGANSGIGWETARELARAGADVILTARSQAKGQDAVDRIRREIPGANVRAKILDLASLRSVRNFADEILQEPKLDLLVNNAGVMAIPKRQVTEDGFEMQMGTNFLGPFALTGLILPALLRAPSPRVTTVSSGAANMGMKKINFDDLQWERSYSPWTAYCQSKLADLLFTRELSRRYSTSRSKLLSNAAHPGFAITNLQTSGPGRQPNMLEKIMAAFLSQDAAHGALPTLRAAAATDAAPGDYYGPDRMFGLKGDPISIALPKPAQDDAAAWKLWEVSEKLTGVVFPAL